MEVFIGASVTEWSKVLRSGRSVFARVGSSPTACIFSFREMEDMSSRIHSPMNEIMLLEL